jgi:hypothetical protein
MIAMREKPNHCFPACLASCLTDDGGTKLQELLVRLFPDKLRYGKGIEEGIPPTTKEMEELVVAVGLCKKAAHLTFGHDKMIDDLKNKQFPANDLNKFLLISTTGERHCWRVDAVEEDGLQVMEPMIGDFKKMTWEEFRSEGKAFLVFLD